MLSPDKTLEEYDTEFDIKLISIPPYTGYPEKRDEAIENYVNDKVLQADVWQMFIPKATRPKYAMPETRLALKGVSSLEQLEAILGSTKKWEWPRVIYEFAHHNPDASPHDMVDYATRALTAVSEERNQRIERGKKPSPDDITSLATSGLAAANTTASEPKRKWWQFGKRSTRKANRKSRKTRKSRK